MLCCLLTKLWLFLWRMQPVAELVWEIAALEEEVVRRELHLLSLYRATFDQYLGISPRVSGQVHTLPATFEGFQCWDFILHRNSESRQCTKAKVIVRWVKKRTVKAAERKLMKVLSGWEISRSQHPTTCQQFQIVDMYGRFFLFIHSVFTIKSSQLNPPNSCQCYLNIFLPLRIQALAFSNETSQSEIIWRNFHIIEVFTGTAKIVLRAF